MRKRCTKVTDKALIVVAHPDDEVLFFSSILDQNNIESHVICITDGNADKRGLERNKEFESAMKFYNVSSFDKYNFPDLYDVGLDKKSLEEKLRESLHNLKIHDNTDWIIFTHGPFGDYGHPHHIEASYVLHQIFKGSDQKIYTPNVLDHAKGISFQKESEIQKNWQRKLKVLTSIYKEEYKRFVSLVPARAKESFLLSNSETYQILNYLVNDMELGELKDLAPYKESLKLFKENGLKRKF